MIPDVSVVLMTFSCRDDAVKWRDAGPERPWNIAKSSSEAHGNKVAKETADRDGDQRNRFKEMMKSFHDERRRV